MAQAPMEYAWNSRVELLFSRNDIPVFLPIERRIWNTIGVTDRG